MGTSSIYGGPSNSNPKDNPLLPKDFDLGEKEKPENNNSKEDDILKADENTNKISNKDLDPKKEVSWKDAKSYMSKYASGKYKSSRRAISNQIKAYGGSRAAAKTARAGISTVISLGKFTNTISSSGFKSALEEYKIDFENQSPREVLNHLTNILAPIPITKDDAVARKALIVTLEYVYELFEEESIDYDLLDENSFNLMVPKFIENYIYERIINDLGSRIESNSDTSQEAVNIEMELKEYINAKVEIAFKGMNFSQINFNEPKINNKVESLINQCYTLIEE